jgi:hypothetical protein
MRTLVFLRLLSITVAMLAFSAACFAHIDVGISVSLRTSSDTRVRTAHLPC